MAVALRLAGRALGRVWPNPAVGAILVKDGEVIARGSTGDGGRPHAEAVALARAGQRARGATLFVTLEPCSHEGRGRPCTEAIIEAGVVRVVSAVDDPDPRVNGEGYSRLRAAGIEVATGILGLAARWMTLGHILRVTAGRPFVQLKLAVSSDGLVAPGQGRPVWVTGEVARARAHLLRARADAILIGRGTVLADDPTLTCRLPGLSHHSPIRVVLDSALRLPPRARLLSDGPAPPVWVVTTQEGSHARADALTTAGARIMRVGAGPDGRVDLRAALATLAEHGVTRLLVEGGPSVARSFLDAGLVDEAIVFQGTAPAAGGGLLPFVDSGIDRIAGSDRFELHADRSIGSDRMRVWRRRE